MTERFIKFIRSPKAEFLLTKPIVFALLALAVLRARREPGHPDGLEVGECYIGDHKTIGATRQQYRTALKYLVSSKFFKILETCRTRKKSTTGSTTVGTKVKLLNSDVFDINLEEDNHPANHCPTTDQPPTNHEEEGRRRKKNEKESHPSIPSKKSQKPKSILMDDDFSSKKEIIPGIALTAGELEACIKIKGDIERVKAAMEYIQRNPQRKCEIKDWPRALSRWKIENKAEINIAENIIFAEELCREYENYSPTWRCYMTNHLKTDQRGILFENQSGYIDAIFIALTDAEFQEKCTNLLITNKMRKLTHV